MASLVTQLAEEEIGRHCFPEDGLDLVVNWNRPVLGPGEEVDSTSFFDVTPHCAQVGSRAVEKLTCKTGQSQLALPS